MLKKFLSWFKFEGIECADGYQMLGIIKGLIKVFSWLSLFFGVFFFFVILIFGGGPDAPRMISILSLLLGLIYFVMFYLISSIIEILVHIEDNTKRTTLLLGGREK